MMKYVIGIDLGTSAVKIILADQIGNIVHEVSKSYPLIQEKSGYSEQNPNLWLEQVVKGLSELLTNFNGTAKDIEGISFSGQMHGLVLLDEKNTVLRNAILWNDTRTTEQCQQIYQTIGEKRLLEITKNPALEGFTLPKLLWVKQHEPELYKQAEKFVLPKDYVRYKITGKLQMEYSDAAGTLLLDIKSKEWSQEICNLMGIDRELCPPLIESTSEVGNITPDFAAVSGLSETTRVFAGGADNACGAIGSGILDEGKTLCSIGTSGVVLSYEATSDKDFGGKVHYFNHAAPDAYYTMGVTLAAGYSLNWFKEVFAANETFDDFVSEVGAIPIGSNGLLFTPYITGERTPHADAAIRGSFIGMDSSHRRADFVRAVMEGITFSLNESIQLMRESGKKIETVISLGGGAKNETWLQMQADIFNTNVVKLSTEQGPAMGAAMIAAYGCNWFKSLNECANVFLHVDRIFYPNKRNVKKYARLFTLYQQVYQSTKRINDELQNIRTAETDD